jgi:hypothetical protein
MVCGYGARTEEATMDDLGNELRRLGFGSGKANRAMHVAIAEERPAVVVKSASARDSLAAIAAAYNAKVITAEQAERLAARVSDPQAPTQAHTQPAKPPRFRPTLGEIVRSK